VRPDRGTTPGKDQGKFLRKTDLGAGGLHGPWHRRTLEAPL